MQSEILNIVDIIKKNPITKLSKTYNNKLLTKIKETFTENEQQLFISSFYLYLNYNKDEFVISLDDIWEWLGFNKKDAAKRLLENSFKENIDYKYIVIRTDEQTKVSRGGGNKITVLLTVRCFKLFCIKAGTKKAKEIHEYFIKLEELLQDIILEECDEIKLQLENKDKEYEIKLKNRDEEYKIELKKQKQLERQEILLKKYDSIGPLVYIIKVKTYDDDTYVCKIGESRVGITNRFNEHKQNYEEVLLLDCFKVEKSKDFESFLHNHRDIKPSKVKNLENHEKENELFLIGKKLTYQNVINIITYNIKNYNYFSQNDLEKEKINNENLKLIKDISSSDNFQEFFMKYMKEVTDQNKILLDEIYDLKQSNKEILEKLNTSNCKTTTNFNEPLVTVGPRLQKINPENLKLIKVYETVSELMKEDIKYKRPSVNKAVENNTIYHGYRWNLVNRHIDPTIVDVKQTKEIITKIDTIGFIAKINNEKTEILNVYLDRKIACKYNDYSSHSALDNPVKKGLLTNGFYYMLYEHCHEKLKEDFENKHGIPILYTNGVGQYDSDNNLIKEFRCKNYCSKLLKISDKSLSKSLENNISYNNHYYKYLGCKDKCL